MAFNGEASLEPAKKNWACPLVGNGAVGFCLVKGMKFPCLFIARIVAPLTVPALMVSKPLGVLAAVSKSKAEAICWLLASKS